MKLFSAMAAAPLAIGLAIGFSACSAILPVESASMAAPKTELRIGAAAVAVTPFGQHQDWNGGVSATGVWGEKFTDQNGNGTWDGGEVWEDDPGNTELDASSKNKYDGVYLAGFGDKRLATGKHDDLWARTIVLDYGATRIAIVSVDFIGYYSDGKPKWQANYRQSDCI